MTIKRAAKQDYPDYSLELEDQTATGVWTTYDVRHDGCVHMRKYWNAPKDEPGRDALPAHKAGEDYLHVCDLEQHIADLQEVLRLAKEWRDGWPE